MSGCRSERRQGRDLHHHQRRPRHAWGAARMTKGPHCFGCPVPGGWAYGGGTRNGLQWATHVSAGSETTYRRHDSPGSYWVTQAGQSVPKDIDKALTTLVFLRRFAERHTP